jgi:hypothetical protein
MKNKPPATKVGNPLSGSSTIIESGNVVLGNNNHARSSWIVQLTVSFVGLGIAPSGPHTICLIGKKLGKEKRIFVK